MPNKKNTSKFGRFVLGEAGGTRKLSVALGISQTTVQHWLAKRATPGAELCEKLLKLADGKLTLSDIVKGTSA